MQELTQDCRWGQYSKIIDTNLREYPDVFQDTVVAWPNMSWLNVLKIGGRNAWTRILQSDRGCQSSSLFTRNSQKPPRKRSSPLLASARIANGSISPEGVLAICFRKHDESQIQATDEIASWAGHLTHTGERSWPIGLTTTSQGAMVSTIFRWGSAESVSASP